MLELYCLVLFMIAAAVIAVSIRDLLSTVVALGAVGLALAVAFLILKAPDLAVTQLVVEILCLVLLIRAVVSRSRREPGRGVMVAIGVVTLVSVALLFVALSLMMREMTWFGDAAMRVSRQYVDRGLVHGGTLNVVNEILLNYRGYDTLGEATVFFTAVIGILAVLRRHGRKKAAEVEEQ